MFKLIVLVSLLALCQAAPFNENNPTPKSQPALPRPSPINPDIPSDPKPEEKITFINDKTKEDLLGVPLDTMKQKEQPQKRETDKATMDHENCHILDDKNQKDEGVKGIIKRATTNTQTPQNPPEKSDPQIKQPDQPLHCTGEGCEHSGHHGTFKRETETSRTTESPGASTKGKSKPYVATKPDNFTQKVKRQVSNETPTAQPQPEQPDEGDKKETPEGKMSKRDISVPLTSMDKPKDPEFENEDENENKEKKSSF